MQAVLEAGWLGHPLAAQLLRANALPSAWAHPSRLAGWTGFSEAAWRAFTQALTQPAASTVPGDSAQVILHKHLSAALLKDPDLHLGWIDDWGDPALPLCIAPEALWRDLQRHAGLLVLGPGIRQTIVRSDLSVILGKLGGSALDFVRQLAVRLWPGGPDAPRTIPAECDAQADRWGTELLRRALEAGGPPVARRGVLRLPVESDAQVLPAELADPLHALSLCRELVNFLDAPWLSHFPALR